MSARTRAIASIAAAPDRDDRMLEQPAADQLDLDARVLDQLDRDARAVGHDGGREVARQVPRELHRRRAAVDEHHLAGPHHAAPRPGRSRPCPPAPRAGGRRSRRRPARRAARRHARAAAAPRPRARAGRAGWCPPRAAELPAELLATTWPSRCRSSRMCSLRCCGQHGVYLHDICMTCTILHVYLRAWSTATRAVRR